MAKSKVPKKIVEVFGYHSPRRVREWALYLEAMEQQADFPVEFFGVCNEKLGKCDGGALLTDILTMLDLSVTRFPDLKLPTFTWSTYHAQPQHLFLTLADKKSPVTNDVLDKLITNNHVEWGCAGVPDYKVYGRAMNTQWARRSMTLDGFETSRVELIARNIPQEMKQDVNIHKSLAMADPSIYLRYVVEHPPKTCDLATLYLAEPAGSVMDYLARQIEQVEPAGEELAKEWAKTPVRYGIQIPGPIWEKMAEVMAPAPEQLLRFAYAAGSVPFGPLMNLGITPDYYFYHRNNELERTEDFERDMAAILAHVNAGGSPPAVAWENVVNTTGWVEKIQQPPFLESFASALSRGLDLTLPVRKLKHKLLPYGATYASMPGSAYDGVPTVPLGDLLPSRIKQLAEDIKYRREKMGLGLNGDATGPGMVTQDLDLI